MNGLNDAYSLGNFMGSWNNLYNQIKISISIDGSPFMLVALACQKDDGPRAYLPEDMLLTINLSNVKTFEIEARTH